MVNIENSNGIRFGAISCKSLDYDIAYQIYDIVLDNFRKETEKEILESGYDDELVESLLQELDESEYDYEISGDWEFDGLKGELFFLGGAMTLLITNSPHTTNAPLCSLCVPNAGDIDSSDGVDGFKTYTVPSSWLIGEIYE